MPIRMPMFCVLPAAFIGIAFLAGCGQSNQEPSATVDGTPAAEAGDEEYHPHDVPITEEQKQQLREDTAHFPKAVDIIQEFRDVTERETKDGIPENPHEVHQSLDKVDLVLQWLPGIARNSEVPEENWKQINMAANDLRNSFEEVHQNIDNKQDPDFASVAGEIDQQIARLKEIARTQPAAAGEPQQP